MAKKRIDVEIGANNKTAAGLKAAKASFKAFGQSIKNVASSAIASLKRIGTVGVFAFAGMIRHAAAFRLAMANVQTMLSSDKSMLPELTKQVRELSSEFGLAKDTLANGLYNALSAGVPAGNAIEFLRVASKAAVGGVTDVNTAVDGLTTVLNAYGIEASKVSQVSDILFTVVKEGKINFTELSQNIGTVAPFAKVAQIGIEDLAAMIATLVKVEKPERAMTALRQSMVYAAEQGKPLLKVLDELEGKTLEELMAMGINQKSAAGIAIMSGNIAVLRKELDIFANTAGNANAAFEDVTPAQGWTRLWQTLLAVVSQVGEAIDKSIGPSISRLTERIRELIKDGTVDEWAGKAVEAIKTLAGWIKQFATVAKQVIDMRMEIMWVAIAGALGVAGVKAAMFATSLYGVAKAALVAAGGMSKLTASMLTFKALGALELFLASGAAVAYFAKTLWESHKATLALIKSQKDLKAMESKTQEKYGTRNAETLRRIRTTMQGGTDAEKATVERMFPEAAAAWKKGGKTATAPQVMAGKIGLGSVTPGKIGGGGIGAQTSMLSESDLFTMMQAGTGAKRESELSELQGINEKLETLIGVTGGIE